MPPRRRRNSGSADRPDSFQSPNSDGSGADGSEISREGSAGSGMPGPPSPLTPSNPVTLNRATYSDLSFWPRYGEASISMGPERRYGGERPRTIRGPKFVEMMATRRLVSLEGLVRVDVANDRGNWYGNSTVYSKHPILKQVVDEIFDWPRQFEELMERQFGRDYSFPTECSDSNGKYWFLSMCNVAIVLGAQLANWKLLYDIGQISDNFQDIEVAAKATWRPAAFNTFVNSLDRIRWFQEWLDLGKMMAEPLWDGVADHPILWTDLETDDHKLKNSAAGTNGSGAGKGGPSTGNKTSFKQTTGSAWDLTDRANYIRALASMLAGSLTVGGHTAAQGLKVTEAWRSVRDIIQTPKYISASGLGASRIVTDASRYNDILYRSALSLKDDDTTDEVLRYPIATTDTSMIRLRSMGPPSQTRLTSHCRTTSFIKLDSKVFSLGIDHPVKGNFDSELVDAFTFINADGTETFVIPDTLFNTEAAALKSRQYPWRLNDNAHIIATDATLSADEISQAWFAKDADHDLEIPYRDLERAYAYWLARVFKVPQNY